jgi:hypothetical protein
MRFDSRTDRFRMADADSFYGSISRPLALHSEDLRRTDSLNIDATANRIKVSTERSQLLADV